MANSDIGYISKENFLKLLPDRVPVRKSVKETAKFPLYCHAPCTGPIPLNTRDGQNVILENAVLYGPENPEDVAELEVIKSPRARRVENLDVVDDPEPKKAGFLDNLFTLDD